MPLVTAVGAIGGLTFILASMLVLANRKLHVEEDPRIDDISDLLPGANCGACGFAGCRAFAEAVIKGETPPATCTVMSTDEREEVAGYLGVDAGAADRRVARSLSRRSTTAVLL